eukprot:6245517-Pyramimonas_sp.AAC.2
MCGLIADPVVGVSQGVCARRAAGDQGGDAHHKSATPGHHGAGPASMRHQWRHAWSLCVLSTFDSTKQWLHISRLSP